MSVVGAVAVALVALIGAFNVILRDRLNHEADNALSARASAELGSLRIVSGRVAAPEVPDAGVPDAQAWVFSGQRLVEQPPSDPATRRAAELLRGGARRTLDLPGARTRLYAVPVVANGRRRGSVVVAISLSPYDDTAQTALIASLVLGAVLLLTVAIAARILISGALRPVARMTQQAAAWSQADSGQRFSLGQPRDELTQLASTLDGLLDRVASSLRHEQRFSAELSHELRSPLASVIAEAQLALRHGGTIEAQRAGHERVLAAAQQMRRTLDTLLMAARVEHDQSLGTGDAVAAARAAARGCAAFAAGHGVAVEVDEPRAPIRLGVDTDVAERVLAPLVENACRFGASLVRIGVQQLGGAVVFTVRDDGPGIRDENRERVFEPGWRDGLVAHGGDRGAGLGLPLARRLARAAGGDVSAEPSAGGAWFSARLPPG